MSGPNRESDRSPESRVDDRALEEFFSGQGAVRAAWRAAKPADDAPPAALDAHILHMAAQAAKPAPAAVRAAPKRGWSGAHGGWALAASLLLGSAVLLRLTESPEYLAQPAGQRPALEPRSVESRREQAAATTLSDAAANTAANTAANPAAVAPEGSAPAADAVAPQAATPAPESTAVAAAPPSGKAQARTSDARTASDQVSGRTQQQPAQADEAEPKRAEAARNAPVVVPAAPPAALEMAVAAPEAFPAEDAAVRAPAPLARPAAVLAPDSAPPPPAAQPPAAPPALAEAERIETPLLEPLPQSAPAFAPKPAAAASAKRRADRQEQAEAASHWPPVATQAAGPSSTEVALAVKRLLAAEQAGRGQAQAASAWVCAPAEFTVTQSTSERATVNVSAECYGLLTLAGPRAGWQMQPSKRQEQRSLQHLADRGWRWEADHLPPQISPATALRWWQAQRAAMGLSPAQLDLVQEQLNRLPQ